jgi:hypothetical protein
MANKELLLRAAFPRLKEVEAINSCSLSVIFRRHHRTSPIKSSNKPAHESSGKYTNRQKEAKQYRSKMALGLIPLLIY